MNVRLPAVLALAVLTGCSGTDRPSGTAADDGPATETAANSTGGNARGANAAGADETAGVATFESLIHSVEQSVQNGKFDEAYRFAERALELKPEDQDALFMAAQLAQRRGVEVEEEDGDREAGDAFYLKSAEYLQRVDDFPSAGGERERQFARQVYYNAARAHAAQEDHAAAVAALEKSFAAGFDNYRLIDGEADFDELRETSLFTESVTPRREAYNQVRREAIAAQLASHQPYDFDFELVSTKGETVKLADFRGKVLIVDFWGTWCPPCRQEIPHFIELLETYGADGLEIVGINYERAEPEEAAADINEFAKVFGITYPCLLGDEETQRRVPSFQGFPTTLFIDTEGTVRLQLVGYHPYEHLEGIVTTLMAETGAGQ